MPSNIPPSIKKLQHTMPEEVKGFVATFRSEVLPLTLRDIIVGNRDYYLNFPSWQRNYIWKRTDAMLEIDSILRGMFSGVFTGYRRDGKLWFIDGKQRFTAADQFYRGILRTLTAHELRRMDPGPITPIEPGRWYKGLSAYWQDRFLSYRVVLAILDVEDEWVIRTQFRRMNRGKLLKAGEILETHHSFAMAVVNRLIADHKFWQETYKGNTEREEDKHACVTMLYSELNRGYRSLRPDVLFVFASGEDDAQLTEDTYAVMMLRMDQIDHLFRGAQIIGKSDIIPLIQGVHHLIEAGYDPLLSKLGCLSGWFTDAKTTQLIIRSKNDTYYATSFDRLSHQEVQEEFWRREKNRMLASRGLVKSEQALPQLLLETSAR